MKKLGLLMMPLMAISLLASCGGSTPTDGIKFSLQETSVALSNNTAVVHLDWTPDDHSIEFNNFTFTLDNRSSITSTVTPSKDATSRPLPLTITFSSVLSSDDTGDLRFHYKDKTAGNEGDAEVENIEIVVAPSFNVESPVIYSLDVQAAPISLSWMPSDHLLEFTDFSFTGSTAEVLYIEPVVMDDNPIFIYIHFTDDLTEDDQGDLNFHYKDKTAGIEGDAKVENIYIAVDTKPLSFKVNSPAIYDSGSQTAPIHLSWLPSDHSLEFTNFSFTGTKAEVSGVTKVMGGNPIEVVVHFKEELTENDQGSLNFHYKDNTTGIEGDEGIENISIKLLYFSVESPVICEVDSQDAPIHLSWLPSDHSLEFTNFSFTGTKAEVSGVTKVMGGNPIEVVVHFKEELTENDQGSLNFHYKDNTTGSEGDEKVENIYIATDVQPVYFSVQSPVIYSLDVQAAPISLSWMPSDHLLEFTDFSFTGSTAEVLYIEPVVMDDNPIFIYIHFTDDLTEDDQGDLNFHYKDKTAGIEGDGEVEDIYIKYIPFPSMN